MTISTDGDGGRHAAGLRAGTKVAIAGPTGTLPDLPRRHPRLLLLAAGVGITPFRALVEGGGFAPGEVVLLYRVADAEQVLFGDELGDLAVRNDVTVSIVAGPRRAHGSWLPEGVDGSDREVLLRMVPDLLECDVVVCGPIGWSAAVRRAAHAAGVADRDVQTEEFGW